MKANEAPEKLYITLSELTEDGRTFVLDHHIDYPICTEYVRIDAFIEKTVNWLINNTDITPTDIKIYRKFMKGE